MDANVSWYIVLFIALAALLYSQRKTDITAADIDFMQQFMSQTLPFEEWTHRNHVRYAFLTTFAVSHDATTSDTINEQVYHRVKYSIQKFNAKHKEKLNIGYHETITHFWIKLVVDAYLTKTPSSFERFFDSHAELQTFTTIFDYYSKDLLYSSEAKESFVEPDKKRF
jgi:hypothetical protein